MKKIYATIEIDFDSRFSRLDCSDEYIANLICERANRHNHTVENGICIDHVRVKSCAQTPQNLYYTAL